MTDPRKEFSKFARPLAREIYDYAMTLGKAQGITDVRVTISRDGHTQNAVEGGIVNKIVSGETAHVCVALYAGDRTLSFTRNSADKRGILEAVEQNIKVIHLVPPNADKRPLEAQKVHTAATPDLDQFDANPPSDETLKAYAIEMEKTAMAQDKVKTTRSVSATKSLSQSYTLATNGYEHEDSRTHYSVGASVIAEDDSGMQVDGEYYGARYFEDIPPAAELGEKAGKNAASKLGAVVPETAQLPVVLDNDAAQDFFGAAYSALYGSAVYRDQTFFKGKIGEQVMAAGVTLEDDPLIKRASNSRAVDAQGVKMEKITFIENGVLKTYSLNLMEARQLKMEPNGREGGRTNTRVLPGDKTPDELIADIKEGIYVKGFNGGQVDVNNGTHSRQAYGVMIRDGKITNEAVSGFVVSGNLKDMFMNVVLANDTPKIPGRYSLAAPTTRINGVTIAGKKKEEPKP